MGAAPGRPEERTRRLSAWEGYWKNRRVAGTLLPLQPSPSDTLPPTWSTTLWPPMRHSQDWSQGPGQSTCLLLSGRAHGSLEYSIGTLSDQGLLFQPRGFWAAWGPTSFRAEAEPCFHKSHENPPSTERTSTFLLQMGHQESFGHSS